MDKVSSDGEDEKGFMRWRQKKPKPGQKPKQNFPKPRPNPEAAENSAREVEPANDEVDMLDALVGESAELVT